MPVDEMLVILSNEPELQATLEVISNSRIWFSDPESSTCCLASFTVLTTILYG